MKTEKVTVYFYQSYGGTPKATVRIGEDWQSGKTYGEIEKLRAEGKQEPKEYVLDIQYLEELLEKMIEERGYTIAKNNRQKYTRLIINQ